MIASMKVTSKNQVTFPKKILDALGVKKGDRLKVELKGKKLVVEPEGLGYLDFIEKHKLKLKLPEGKTIEDMIAKGRDEYYKKKLSRY